MKPVEQHEKFEILVLHFLNSKRLLDALVFGGGTMLRLCFDLNRYSMDMDFYFKKQMDHNQYFEKLTKETGTRYERTDSQNKFNTILIELKHSQYPRRLKIEINKNRIYSTYRRAIAFSPHSTHQVPVDVIPMEQMMTNKIEALHNRKEIRDAFDIEFLIRRGVKFPQSVVDADKTLSIIRKFSRNDFNVKLGSMLPPDVREYYRQNRFSYLESHLSQIIEE